MGDNFNKWLWLLFILLMSAYVLFVHAMSSLAVDLQTLLERHERMMTGNSEFYNPWQYRIFSAFLLESIIRCYHFVLPHQPEIVPFLLLRFVQNILIFYSSLFYYRRLGISNPFLSAAGLLILCFCISNSVFQSDLSFNTYFDVLFYLAAALFILHDRLMWLIPLAIIAGLNRETSGFIPVMALAPFSLSLSRRTWIVSGISLLSFVLVFILIRLYYGFRPAVGIHGMSSPADFLIFNFTFLRMYPLLFGTLTFIPIIVVLKLKSIPALLRHWFWLIVPFWFLIHFSKSTAMETRLFLVPQALIFIPAFLCLIEKWYDKPMPLVSDR